MLTSQSANQPTEKVKHTRQTYTRPTLRSQQHIYSHADCPTSLAGRPKKLVRLSPLRLLRHLAKDFSLSACFAEGSGQLPG